MKEVDIVILSWNRSKMTVEAVESALAQKEVNQQIWIVDQGSDYEELKTIKHFALNHSNIKIIELDKNVGVAAGRNIGMRAGKAKYIFSLDNDAVFDSCNTLKYALERFEKDQEIGIIGFRILNYYSGQDDQQSWVYPKNQKNMRSSEFTTTRFIGGGHGIRRKAFEKSGGYDDRLFFYWEEVDLSYKVINLGFKIIYYPKASILHKVSPEARLNWNNGRYYYLVRNRIYLHFKFEQNIIGTIIVTLGYLVKGFYNKLPRQTLRGIYDSGRMCMEIWPKISHSQALTKEAHKYIKENEMRYRGKLLERIKNEVFVKLPC